MSTPAKIDLNARPGGVPLTRSTLPRWAPWATLIAAVVVGVLLYAALGVSAGLAVIATVVLYCVAIYAWSIAVEGGRRAKNRVVTAIVTATFLLALLPLASVLFTVVQHGLKPMNIDFFTFSMKGIVGAGGGIYHAIMGTLIITGIAALISVPIGIMCAIYLVEYGVKTRLARFVTFFVDVMTGIPSIVAGLFSYALFALIFGPAVSMGFMGSVALSVLMIPIVVRATEEMLKLVPNELREAAFGLGVPKWRVITKIVLPTALAGIATGVTLAIARVIGETAPLLITVGNPDQTNFNPFSGDMQTLPVFAYNQFMNPGVPPEASIDRAWGAALTLVVIVMVLNLAARLVTRFFAPKTNS